MRILSITAQKPDSTGSGIYLSYLQNAFEKAGHNVALVYGCDSHDAYSFAYPKFPVVFNTPRLAFSVVGMSDTMPYASSIYRQLTPGQLDVFEREFRDALVRARDEFKPDVVICHHLYGVLTFAFDVFSGAMDATHSASCTASASAETLAAAASIVNENRPPRILAICHGSDLRQLCSHRLFYERVQACLPKLDAVIALHESQKSQIESLFPEASKNVFALGAAFDNALFHYSDEMQAALLKSAEPEHESAFSAGVTIASAKPPAPTAPAKPPAAPAYTSHAPHSVHGEQRAQRCAFNLCYVGKIAYKKGVHSLLRALALDDSTHIAQLSLIGGSGSADEWSAAQNLASHLPFPVHMPGALPHDELVSHYQASDIFVLASYYEGLPLCVIEALACGCAVVCSNTTGFQAWMTRHVPHALCYFVDLPAECQPGVPVSSELPSYELRFKRALDTMIHTLLHETYAQRIQRLQRIQRELAALTWDSLATRILDAGKGSARGV